MQKFSSNETSSLGFKSFLDQLRIKQFRFNSKLAIFENKLNYRVNQSNSLINFEKNGFSSELENKT